MTRLTSTIVLAASLAAVHANQAQNNADDHAAFLRFAAENSKHYSSSVQMNERFAEWKKTDDIIKSKSGKGMWLKHNKFSDWTDKEKAGLIGEIDQLVSGEEFEAKHIGHDNDGFGREL